MEDVNKTLDTVAKEIDIKNLKRENDYLKSKINDLRKENNSFLYSALVKFQGEMPIVGKNSQAFGRQRYADLAEIIKISRPILVKNNLAITQIFNEDKLITRVCHSSGQYIDSIIKITINDRDDKSNKLHLLGASISFLRRYAYSAILGIATDEEGEAS